MERTIPRARPSESSRCFRVARLVALGLLWVGISIPGAALAIPSFTLDIEPGDMQNNFNVPRFTLTNTSTAGEEIVGFSITIGDATRYYYDFVADPNSDPLGEDAHFATEATTGARLITGDRINDLAGSVLIDWAFDDFQVTESLVFQADIDPLTAQAGGLQSTDSRFAFHNNGDAENAEISVRFSNGGIYLGRFEDHEDGLRDAFHFSGQGSLGTPIVSNGPGPGSTAPVPEPGAALLFGFGLLSVAWRPRGIAAD